MLLRPFASSPATTTTTHLVPSYPLIHCAKPFKPFFNSRPYKPSNLTLLTKTHSSSTTTFNFTTPPQDPSDNNDYEFPENDVVIDEEGSPWEGAVMYKRNASVSHLEYCTTLERLGLGKIASDVSRNRASQLGLRVVKSVKEYVNGTPVLISVDVVRKKQKLRLDGIVRTVISLHCNRCGGPAAQSVYSDFSLLLCEEPIQEPDIINMGVIFGEDKFKNSGTTVENDDEDSLIDFDDQLYFPGDVKVIDISKNIRDLIHLEITITAVCDPKCKGLCLKCGTNLNNSNCSCNADKMDEKGYGPLGSLREQMQRT